MTFLRSTILFGLLLTLLACGSDPVGTKDTEDANDDAGESSDDATDDGSDSTPSGSTGGAKDAGGTVKDAGSTPPSSGPKDAGVTKPDSGTSPRPSTDAGTTQGSDAGKAIDGVDAGSQDGGGFMLPDLFPSTGDAGSTTPAPSTGERNVKGPCKDLQLLCFDIFDMWIINPSDCATCNDGKGCQGCAIPFAF